MSQAAIGDVTGESHEPPHARWGESKDTGNPDCYGGSGPQCCPRLTVLLQSVRNQVSMSCGPWSWRWAAMSDTVILICGQARLGEKSRSFAKYPVA